MRKRLWPKSRQIGTALVESVEHYVSRLAWISGVDVRALCSKERHFVEQRRGGDTRIARVRGPRWTYKQKIQVLEQFTGLQTIRCGSLIVLDEVLISRALYRHSACRHWCPECFKDWEDDDSWEPLIWQSAPDIGCPIHGCDLLSRCECCLSTQRLSERYERRRHCWCCGAGLAGDGVRSTRTDYHRWMQHQMCDLVRFCSTDGQERVPASRYATFLNGLAFLPSIRENLPWPIKLALRRANSNRRDNRATLETLMNVCALQGVSVVKMLVDPVGASSRSLIDLWEGYRSIEFPGKPCSVRVRVFDECLNEVLFNCRRMYLPPAQFFLREMRFRHRLIGDFSDAYEQYECLRTSKGRLLYSKRAFRYALELLRQGSPETTGELSITAIAIRVATHAKISITRAEQLTRVAFHSKVAIERAVAQIDASGVRKKVKTYPNPHREVCSL